MTIGGGITSLKISEVAGYIDQIETGGGSATEIPLTTERDEMCVVILVSDVNYDYAFDSLTFKTKDGKSSYLTETLSSYDSNHAMQYRLCSFSYDSSQIGVILYIRTVYPEPVTLKLDGELDGDYTSGTELEVDLSTSKIIFINQNE